MVIFFNLAFILCEINNTIRWIVFDTYCDIDYNTVNKTAGKGGRAPRLANNV